MHSHPKYVQSLPGELHVRMQTPQLVSSESAYVKTAK